ncbi:putative cyclin domain-containing protein [Helianthus annuus]|nr:putative cyclin domain-containing protein [Helianthus annuus]
MDLQVCEARYVFEAKTIKKMELLVLTTLKWRMQTVTPFSFIDAFIEKLGCDQPISRSLILRATQLILCLINGIDFLEFRPSEIAAGVEISLVGQTKMSSLFQHVQKVCEARYVFEAKTIQKMELLVLTTLKWRMQTVTPFSFIDTFIEGVFYRMRYFMILIIY